MNKFNFYRGLVLEHCPVMSGPSITAITTILNCPSNDATTTSIIVKAMATRTCESRIAFVKDRNGCIVTAVPYILGTRSVGVKLSLSHLELNEHEMERVRLTIINGLALFTGLRVVGYPAGNGEAKVVIHKPMPTVWVDSDETLTDWFSPMLKFAASIGYAFESNKEFNAHPECRNIVKACYDDNPSFFLNLEAIPVALILFDSLLNICEGKARVRILTAVGSDHDDPTEVRVDKVQNLTSNYPVSPNDIHVVLESADKTDYMQPGDILIDDYGVNIVAAEKVGVTGFKFKKDVGVVTDILRSIQNILNGVPQC